MESAISFSFAPPCFLMSYHSLLIEYPGTMSKIL
jgi:hypothetical protein